LLPVAAGIAAHHGRLAKVKGDEASGVPVDGSLAELVQSRLREYAGLQNLTLPSVDRLPTPAFPPYLSLPGDARLRVELFTRFLCSTLIDADRRRSSATARFYARYAPALTHEDVLCDDVPTLADRLDTAIDRMPPRGSPAVVQLRRGVLAACRAAAADRPPGLFSLTVPTGGGKTPSAMSFALRHARRHGLRRVIVVIPWEPDEGTRSLRKLTTLRASLVNDRTRIKNRVRCILAQQLVEPPMSWLFGGAGLEWLRAVDLPAEERSMVECQLRLLETTERELADLDGRLRKLAYEEGRAKLLMTLPGVSHGTALALLAAFGDVSRFRDGDHAASYLGLVPSTRQSAGHCYHGPITKAGNSHARWMLTQGVQHLATNPGPLGVFYRRLCKRKNRNVAVTAAARKLVTIAYLMLKHNEPYRYAIPQATDRKLSRVRFASTGVRRKAERTPRRDPAATATATAARGEAAVEAVTSREGSAGPAAKRVRRTRSLPAIYRDEGLPPAKAVDQLPAGERRMLVDGGTIAFARRIQEPSPPPPPPPPRRP
jgi:transposase